MKATIEFDDALYKQLKIEAAIQNRKIREMVEEGVRLVLNQPANEESPNEKSDDLPIVRKADKNNPRSYPVLNNKEIENLLVAEDSDQQ